MTTFKIVNVKPDVVENFIDRSENMVTIHIEVMFWNSNEHNKGLSRILATRYHRDSNNITITKEEDVILPRSIAEQAVKEHKVNNRMHYLILDKPRHQEQFSMFFSMYNAYKNLLTRGECHES